MHSSITRLVLSALLVLGICCAPAFAQKYEISPYAGGDFIGSWETVNFKNPAIYGLKGGVFVSDNMEIEGNLGYMNQLNLRGYDYGTHALLWEGAGTYNFFTAKKAGVYPYATFGLGGLTAEVDNVKNVIGPHGDAVYVIPLAQPDTTISPLFPVTTKALVVRSGATFLTFSYGGGVKGQRLAGPLGFRVDLRGRTVPSFYGNGFSMFELTGGLLFSWGER